MDNNSNNSNNNNNSSNNGYKRLTRSKTNRTISGVCGGLGEYMSVDPVIVRIICVAACFFSVGMGALVYLIAALIIPEQM
jgi:phage shock protein C